MGLIFMGTKEEIALGIALQTHVLKSCPIHRQIYCEDELPEDESLNDDANLARAFALAVELVRQHEVYAQEFEHDEHQLTDLLSQVIAAAPSCCPACLPLRVSARSTEVSAFH